MTTETEHEFADVLSTLGTFRAVQSPTNLEARFRTLAEGQLEASSPLQETLEEHGPTVLGYLNALLESESGAEHALRAACGRLDEGETPEFADLLLYARHAALESLSKTGPSHGDLSADERALLLERRLGLKLVDLARTWSTMPMRLRERLLAAAERTLTAREASAPDSPPACPEGRDLVIAEPVDLLKPAEAERYAKHQSECAPCAHWSQTLEDALITKPLQPASPWRELATHREFVAPREDLAISVSVSCCYCHDRLERGAAAFCASCMAPHHPECFETHARCATPACEGTQLILPTSMRSRTPLRRRLIGGTVLGLLGGLFAVAAFTPAFHLTSGEELSVKQEGLVGRPIPNQIYVSAHKREVTNVLGTPERDESDEFGGVLSWYRDGVRVHFDADERLVKASFFGVVESDGPIDANGNKPIFDRSSGWYRPHPWSWRGVVMGMTGPEVIEKIGEADESLPDASGNILLRYTSGNAVIELHGDRMRYQVVAIHFGGAVGADANGNHFVQPVDLTKKLTAQSALATALLEANRVGDLDGVLREQAYLKYDSEGRLDTLYRVEGSIAEGSAGLDLRFDIFTLGGGGKREESMRLAWDGRLVAYSSRWIADDGKVVSETRGKESTRMRLELEVSEQFVPSHQRVVLCDEETLPHNVVVFVLSRLTAHVGHVPWRLLYNDPLAEYGKGSLLAKTPALDHWQGEFVRTVETQNRGGGVPGFRIRVANADCGFRRANSLENSGWIEPVSKERFLELSSPPAPKAEDAEAKPSTPEKQGSRRR